MTTLELNPIRMRPDSRGRLTPVACDFKCGFDRDDARWERLGLPDHLFAADQSDFETEINQLRTHQGQSDVYVINPNGTILAPTFGGGANSLVTEVLGDDAIISSDFGGNPPYEKMKEVARICFKHWLAQSNVLFIIGGKSNNTATLHIKAPGPIISPLVQHLPRLWELVHDFGMTTLELNPIRMRPDSRGRLTPVACDFKCGFDRDDARWERLGLPDHLFAADQSDFETEINQLRTHQGQSDVYVINPNGTILAPTFGGGANSLVTEVLGDDAIISSDFGGNPPYEKMKEVARICFKHWLAQSNVLFIIGGKSNNTDIFTTFRAMGDALREHFSAHGPTPLYVVVGRGGPNLIRGMGALQDTVEALGLPYRFFGFDSAISEVVNYAQAADRWMKGGGREQVAQRLGMRKVA